MTPGRALAGRTADGRGSAPGQRRLLAADVRGDRRRGSACPARGRGRRLRARRQRRAGAGCGPRRGRRADRDATRRRRLHHGVQPRAGPPARRLAGCPHRCVPARRVRPEPGVDGRERVRGACAAGRRRGPAARRRCGRPARRRPARAGAPHPAGQPPRHGAADERIGRGVPRAGGAAGRRRRAGAGSSGLRGGRRRDLLVVAKMDGGPARRRRPCDPARASRSGSGRGCRRRNGIYRSR